MFVCPAAVRAAQRGCSAGALRGGCGYVGTAPGRQLQPPSAVLPQPGGRGGTWEDDHAGMDLLSAGGEDISCEDGTVSFSIHIMTRPHVLFSLIQSLVCVCASLDGRSHPRPGRRHHAGEVRGTWADVS